jgi:tetraacyldisaccharide 4'-kinase
MRETAAEPAEQRLQRLWMSRGALACALLPLAALFGAISALRRALYRRGWWRAQTLPVPVIVVGNLIAGGAGKTPTVMAIVRLLACHGHRPGIVSRGYGRRGADCLDVHADTPVAACGDEPLLLRLRTGAPVAVGRDRVAAARLLLARHPEVDVIVSDDGLQHLRLARSAQVLVFDERGIGNGWLLPAGPLREPFAPTAPARSVVLYNAQAATTPWPGTTARRALAGAVPLAAWWLGQAASLAALRALQGRPLLAVAGVARPQRFFTMLRAAGLTITPLPLPDHHDYAALPWPPETADVVLTEKDAVKIDPQRIGGTRVWVAALDFVPAAAFDLALLGLLALHGNATGTPTETPTGTPPGNRHGNASA